MHNGVAQALDQMLVGQERAKSALATLIEMHSSWFEAADRLHRAPNALLVGPTGTGKSHALNVSSEVLRLPMVVVDSTRLVAAVATEQMTFKSIILQLLQSARKIARESGDLDHDAEHSAERGIIFLDEFDKLRTKDPNSPNAAIQRRLLQFIEGETVFIEASEQYTARSVNTHGILFVAAGAFSGIQDTSVTSQRRQAMSRSPEVGKTIQPQDVVEFGFLHELVARLPVIIRFHELSEAQLEQILEHDDVTPLKFYRQYFARHGLRLDVPRETMQVIAKEAFRGGLGARSLDQALFPILSALAEELSPAGNAGRDFVLTETEYNRLRSRAYA